MNFDGAKLEIRERFGESFTLLNYIRGISPTPPAPVDDTNKALRGLWLVSLYAAFERGVNAVMEAAIEEISTHASKSIQCAPAVHSIFHYARIQSVRDSSNNRAIDSSIELFRATLSDDPLVLRDNPIADRLQNVDGGTLQWAATLLDAPPFVIAGRDTVRLRTLRERRNAVAHGREAASQVGERYTIQDLADLHTTADAEVARFLLHLETHCSTKAYVRRVA